MKYFLITLIITCSFQFGSFSQCENLTCTIPSSSTSLNIDNQTNVTIAVGQVVQIDNMNGTGPITNYGTLYLPNGVISRNIINHGTLIIAGNPSIQNNSYLHNEQTGQVCVVGSGTVLRINSGSYIVNNGAFNIDGSIHFNSYSKLFNTNDACMTVNGNISIDNHSMHCNSGNINVIGNINVSNGGSFSACEGFAPEGGITNLNNNGSYVLSNPCSSCIGPLGATLVSFYLENKPEGNEIFWVTSYERNINQYTLFHSLDGFIWKDIHNESGKEISSNNYYQYFHKNSFEGNNYYYLTWIDSEGFVEKSEIIVGKSQISRKTIVQKVNLLGQIVDDYYRGVVIIQYTDGSTKKEYVK